VPTDAIVMLKEDHVRIRMLFREFQEAGDTATKTKAAIVNRILERFDAKTTVLIESVTHHIEEEEQDWFPKVREGLGRKVPQDIGAEMVELRKTAPRSPAQPSALKRQLTPSSGDGPVDLHSR
jgi:hemerythrin-like domain-containing protein